ncbi:MAG: ImmA/IrrE family metallo-endopeptidase [Candidatus Peribacter sp.]|jgi:hypothetical protein
MTRYDVLESAGTKEARHCAEQVWKNEGDSQIPVDLVKVINALALVRLGTTELPAHVRGMCAEIAPGEGAIAYTPNASFLSKRWTVAHEIGHWCMGHVSSIGAPTSFLKEYHEQEANAFAGALLIPQSDFLAFCKQDKPSIPQIQQRYQVTAPIAGVAIQRPGILKYISAPK